MAQNNKKLKVAVLGSGNIGTDLLVKLRRSELLECVLFAGRNLESVGIRKANELGVNVSDKGIYAVLDNPACCELVFDATSARDHLHHWSLLRDLGTLVIDMTPSQVGHMVIPAINLPGIDKFQNVNMVSCGGQASIPLAHALTQIDKGIEYIEVVSSIASRSAGPATRLNIDEYIENTEEGLRFFTGCAKVKAILILNPADPCIDMQTTISAKVQQPDMDRIRDSIANLEKRIQQYVPGFKIVVQPVYESNRVVMMVRVNGRGDFLPSYAGNLDIINCAAIATAEEYANKHFQSSGNLQDTACPRS
jgi:acetaldehyde dehydrogenase (acetylating)